MSNALFFQFADVFSGDSEIPVTSFALNSVSNLKIFTRTATA